MIGKFEGLKYESRKIQLHRIVLGDLAIEALDRYYFAKKDPGSFNCPVSWCDVHLKKAGG
jgi:hypothetical protein